MHAKKVAVRITYIILGLILSLSLIKSTNERSNQYSLTEEKIKEFEEKVLDKVLMLKQKIAEQGEEKHKKELNYIEALSKKIEINAKIAIEQVNEMQKKLEEKEVTLQNLATDENLTKASEILNKPATKQSKSQKNIMIEKNSKEYKDLTNTEEHRIGMKLLAQSKELRSKVANLSEVFQEWEPTEEAVSIAIKKYFEVLNTEALNYIEDAVEFFDKFSNPDDIKENYEFVPPANNTKELHNLYNNILFSILGNKKQVGKYAQEFEKVKKKWNEQLLVKTINSVFYYKQNDKKEIIERVGSFYAGLKQKMKFVTNQIPKAELFKPFYIIPLPGIVYKLNAMKIAANGLLEIFQAGVNNPSTITERRIKNKLQDVVKSMSLEFQETEYKIFCDLLERTNLDAHVVKEWYLYDISPEQKNLFPKSQKTGSKAEKPSTGPELLLKYFKNLSTLQEALFVIFKRLDASPVQHEEKQLEDNDLIDFVSSICIVTDAQIMMLQIALQDQNELKKNKKPLSYNVHAKLLSLWARMYRVYEYTYEKSIFSQYEKRISASEFRYSPYLTQQFLWSLTECANYVINNCREFMNMEGDKEEQTNEYKQLAKVLDSVHKFYEVMDLNIISNHDKFSMAYIYLQPHKSLCKDLMANIKLDLKTLAEKETSEIGKKRIEKKVCYTLDVIQDLIDPKKINKTRLIEAINNFKKKLAETIKERKDCLEKIQESCITSTYNIFIVLILAIKKENDVRKLQLERELRHRLEQLPAVQSNPNQNARNTEAMGQVPYRNNPTTVSPPSAARRPALASRPTPLPSHTPFAAHDSLTSETHGYGNIIVILVVLLVIIIGVVFFFHKIPEEV